MSNLGPGFDHLNSHLNDEVRAIFRAAADAQPWTVGRDMSRRSASSLTPSRRGPAASAFMMRAARSTDWIVPRLGALLRFGIVESTSVV